MRASPTPETIGISKQIGKCKQDLFFKQKANKKRNCTQNPKYHRLKRERTESLISERK